MSELAPCKQDLYENGTVVGMYDTSYMRAAGMEKIVQATAALTECEVDWHYFAGRAIVKCHEEDFVEVRNALETIYTYVYNTEGPKWCEASNLGIAHFRVRTPELCTEITDVI